MAKSPNPSRRPTWRDIVQAARKCLGTGLRFLKLLWFLAKLWEFFDD